MNTEHPINVPLATPAPAPTGAPAPVAAAPVAPKMKRRHVQFGRPPDTFEPSMRLEPQKANAKA